MTSNINRLYFSSNNGLNCVTSGSIPNLVTSTLTPSHNTQRASPCLSPTSTGWGVSETHSMSITKCILDASPCQTLKQLGFPEETHYTI